MTRRARKAWNGGTRETAMAAARQRTEEAIASGCPRCRNCGGDGGLSAGRICECCGGAGFFVPEGGMPLPRSVDCTMTDPAELARRLREHHEDEPWTGPNGLFVAAATLIETQAREIAELRAAVRDADAEFLRIYRSTPREWHERHATAIRRAQEPTDGR